MDDLAIAAKDPSSILEVLEKDHKFKLKGSGPITYHLGMNFFWDPDGMLCIEPKKYLIRLFKSYKRMFGESPKEVTLT